MKKQPQTGSKSFQESFNKHLRSLHYSSKKKGELQFVFWAFYFLYFFYGIQLIGFPEYVWQISLNDARNAITENVS